MATVPTTTASNSSEKSKKISREKSLPTQADSGQNEKKRKKISHSDSASEERTSTSAQAAEDPMKRPKKKQKQNELKPTSGTNGQVADPNNVGKRPKREKRAKGNKLEEPSPKDKIRIADVPVAYTNPLTDNTLSDLAQRGLAYAYQYAQHIYLPSDFERAAKQLWKFNKARQNWILRNITDPDIITNSYFSLALVYVTSIQGGARNALEKSCKAIKKETKTAKTPELQAQDEVAEAKVEISPSKGKVGSTKKVVFATEDTEPQAANPDVLVPSKAKRKRAKAILKVLKGKVQPHDI